MTEILKTLPAMTPSWLEGALTEAGHAPPPVAAVEVRPMDGLLGAMGEVGIVAVTYGGDTDLPAEFVAKCPLDDDLARLYNSVRLSYQREAGFYRDMAEPLAAATGMRIPMCFVNLAEDLAWAAFYRVSSVYVAWVHAMAASEQGRQVRRFKAMMDGSITAVQRWNAVERMKAHI